MKQFSPDFLAQLEKVDKLQRLLETERSILRRMCNHAYPNGRTAFPTSISFTNCKICGCNSRYADEG